MTRKPTSTYGKRVLDERTFQQLLAAAYTLQEHNDRLHRPISPSNESFWRTATVVALAAVLCLLLGASVHRLSPLPGGLTLPSEVVQQQVPLQRTKPVATVLASDRKPIVTPNRLDSTHSNEADMVAEDTVARHNTRAASPGVQAQKNP